MRVRLFAVAAVALSAALAGCSSTGSSDWFKPSPPPPQVLQFESQPPGASVQTTQGQTCIAPCSLAVPVSAQAISFALKGYEPQTVELTVNQPKGSLFNTPPPVLAPNPVVATLQAVPPPPRKVIRRRPRKVVAKPKPAGPPPMPTQPAITAPEPQQPAQDNVFPPPPPMNSPSAFPPPPQQQTR